MAVPLRPVGGSRGGRRISYTPMSEINVTPLVDVMLVLLIVFMISAPLLAVGVPVDLPRTDAAQLTETDEPLVVSVDANGTVHIRETPVELEELPGKLVAIADARPETTIYVRGDRTIQYGRVMEVMGALNRAGFIRVSLVAELPPLGG